MNSVHLAVHSGDVSESRYNMLLHILVLLRMIAIFSLYCVKPFWGICLFRLLKPIQDIHPCSCLANVKHTRSPTSRRLGNSQTDLIRYTIGIFQVCKSMTQRNFHMCVCEHFCRFRVTSHRIPSLLLCTWHVR